MSEYKFVCESCREPHEMEDRIEICGVSVCPKCKTTLLSIMGYKNHTDILEEDRVMLQRFLNKFVKNHLTNRKK